MVILSYKILHRSYDEVQGGYLADLVMNVSENDGNKDLQIRCRASLPPASPDELVNDFLLEDAQRQLRRMPGYRRGENQISLSPHFQRLSA